MIEIEASDNLIRIGPLRGIRSVEIAALYKSGTEMRYAAGDGFIAAAADTAEPFASSVCRDNEFVSGIYLCDAAGSDKFAGIISGTLMDKTIWIRQLAIHPVCRRKGLGTKSAGLVLRCARESFGAEISCLSVVEENTGGYGFWKILGFTPIKRLNKVFAGDERPYSIVIMQKRLQD